MELFRQAFGVSSFQKKPSVQFNDDVYPLHLLDDTEVHRAAILTFTLRFDDVLDPQKLSSSLSELLEIGDWRKLGGRLRLRDDKRLEIYVPRSFTKERPCCTFSHNYPGVSIEQHPVGKNLPKATHAPSLQPGPENFHSFAVPHGAPVALADYLQDDIPMLSVHTTVFTDATVVAFVFPHVLMDVVGSQALLKSWSLVLAGKASEVPILLDARRDMIIAASDAGGEVAETSEIQRNKLKGFALLRFALRYLWDFVRNRGVERRLICLTAAALIRLRQRAEQDLLRQQGDGAKPFVSDGDLLTAWVAHIVAATLPKPRPITILHAVNARFRLPALRQALGVFVQNMSMGSFTVLSAAEAAGPLGHIAATNRAQLSKQSTETQALAFIREQREQIASNKTMLLICGSPNTLPVPFTNWTKADLFNTVDFGPAVVRHDGGGDDDLDLESPKDRKHAPGLPSHYFASTTQTSALRNSLMRNTFVVLGKDHDGNYWLSGYLAPHAWTILGQAIQKI